MYEIPLFPLNTVLFPGAPVYLHIFEHRYREMMSMCLEKRQPFGVVLIERGEEAYGEADPHLIGCSAEIIRVENLEQGRMNLVAVGRNRFQIDRTHKEMPYLSGWVENIDVHPPQIRSKLVESSQQLLPWMHKYLKVLQKVHNFKVAWDEFPEDPIELGYLAAHMLQVPAEMKQKFLEQNDSEKLLQQICITYRSEINVIKRMVEHAKSQAGQDPDDLFSLN